MEVIPKRHTHKNYATFNGEPFCFGAVNVLDGCIEEVVSYSRAKDTDFHHGYLFSGSVIDAIDDKSAAVFWLTAKHDIYLIDRRNWDDVEHAVKWDTNYGDTWYRDCGLSGEILKAKINQQIKWL